MDLVEVVRGPRTSDETTEKAMAMAHAMSPQLEAKVKAGKLGRKAGEGWYKY